MKYVQRSLPELIYHRATQTPDRPYLVQVEGGSETFGEFLDQVARWVSILREAGVGEGDRVAVMLPTSMLAHHVWLACAWLKAWEVPINIEFRGRILEHVLNDSGASAIVIDAEYSDALATSVANLPALQTAIFPSNGGFTDIKGIRTIGGHELPEKGEPLTAPEGIGAGDVATVVYTSGTTGPSKGCVVPWGEFTWGIDIFHLKGDGSDCQYCPFPINHLSGKCPVYNMAYLGGRVVLRKRFSTSDFWADVNRFGCTTTILLGGTAAFLANQPAAPDDADNSLETVLMAPTIANHKDFERRFDVTIVAAYGMTEIAWPFLTPGPTPNAGTCGSLRPDWEVRLVDNNDNDVAIGEVGELLVRCRQPDSMMKFYLNRPEQTAAAWRGGWFHTGDAFRCDADGNYYFVDRLKDALRRRGENISSFEVEAYVNDYPDIKESAVIAVPSETGEDEVKAVVVPADGVMLDLDDVVSFLKPRMPGFMLPRYFEVVEQLPITPTNKVQKTKLRDQGINERTWDRLAR